MSKDRDFTLAYILGALGIALSLHILLGVLIYAVGFALNLVWNRYRLMRWPILISLIGLILMLGLRFWVASNEGIPVLRTLYLYSLDYLTGFLKENLGIRGIYAFKGARFLLGFLPVSVLTTAVLVGRLISRRFKKQKRALPGKLIQIVPKPAVIAEMRENGEGAFIGVNSDGQAVYLTDHERGMHTQVIGSTGFGKTASVLMPLLSADLKSGKSVIFIDGKGDMESLSSFVSLVKSAGREHDTLIFSPSFPNISNPWNPLASGNPVVQKDRIVGAQIWSEEFYKKKGEDLLQTVLNIFDDLKVTASFPRLAEFLKNPEVDFIKGKSFRNAKIEQDYQALKKALRTDAKNYAGIVADINLFTNSFLKPMFTAEKGEGISLYDIAMNNKIVYFNFPVLMMEDTMKRIGRMVIHDLKTVCSEIQNYVGKEDRRPISVFIDEFASFANESFIELLNKARSAGVGITIIHQSLGDIESVDKNFARQIFENTNVKVVLRVDDPETIERYCRMAGTHQEMKYTFQTDDGIFGRTASGGASMREVDVFNVDPNTFRRLRIGEAVVMVKNTGKIFNVKLDYLDPPQVDLSEIAAEARDQVIEGIVSAISTSKDVSCEDGNAKVEDGPALKNDPFNKFAILVKNAAT